MIVPAFFWAFLIAGYYVWRKDHLNAPRFKARIPDMTVTKEGRVFVGLEIVNVGPSTSIHTWQASFKRQPDGPTHGLSDRMLLEADDEHDPPANIHGPNLRRDYRILTTGETRIGWIAFDAGALSEDETVTLMKTVIIRFTDAFDHHEDILTLPAWALASRK